MSVQLNSFSRLSSIISGLKVVFTQGTDLLHVIKDFVFTLAFVLFAIYEFYCFFRYLFHQ